MKKSTLIKQIVLVLMLVVMLALVSCTFRGCDNQISTTPTTSTNDKNLVDPPIDDPDHIHTEVFDEAVEATCTSTGLTEGMHCSKCGEIFVEQDEIPMIPHTYDDKYDESCNECGHIRDVACSHSQTEVIEGRDATCTEIGYTDGEKCSKCGEILTAQSTIPLLEHVYSPVTTEPTCTNQGYTTYTCTCGDMFISDYIEAFGHSFGGWVIIKEATTKEEGLQEGTCSCGATQTLVIPRKLSEGLNFTLSNDGQSYYVSGLGACADTDIVIPSEHNGLPVTSIGNSAFYLCRSITSITIPDSVTSIGNYAFSRCFFLTSITIPDSVTSIGDYAFNQCTSLASVTIPDSVTSIGDSVFRECTSLASVTIPDSITSISKSAFYHCTSLASVTIPDSVTSIGDFAFYQCTSLASITIPDSVASIGDSVFRECTSLASVTIPNSVTSIGDSVFRECTSLASVTIPDSVTSIGDFAFCQCTSLASVTIPDSVTSIGISAFRECTSLTSITIPDNVTSIGSGAFGYCSLLERLTVGNASPTIGDSAFQNCRNLKSITFVGNIASFMCGTIPYLTNVIISDSVTKIDTYAFLNCASITSITIPNSVTSIGAGSFKNCTALTSIMIPDSVTTIDQNAFENCTSLKSVVLGNSVTIIRYDAFAYCTSLTSIVIPQSVTSMGAAFYGCNPTLLTIYCEASTKPSEWGSLWNLYNNQGGNQQYYIPVVWGYKGE